MNVVKRKNVLPFLLAILSFIIMGIGVLLQTTDVMLLAISLLFISGILISIYDISENITLAMFLFTVLIFLFGRILSKYLFNYSEFGYGIFQTNITDENILISFYQAVFLSITSLIIGFLFSKKNKSTKQSDIITNDWNTVLVWISKIFFFILVIFRILVLLDRASYVNDNSYFDSFKEFESSYPIIIQRLSQSYSVPFFILLSLQLKKKRIIIPISVFLLEGLVSLTTGRRMNFILSVIILVIYFVWDDYTSTREEKKWINKVTVVFGVFLVPVLIFVSNLVLEFRNGISSSNTTINSIFGEFFYKQGVTLTTVLHSFLYNNEYPQSSQFVIGPIESFIKNNIIASLFFESELLVGQSIASGLSSPLFGHRVSYFIDSNAYLNGRGYGSSYIAESYVDWGILGVIIVSFIIGFILYKLYDNLGQNLFFTTFSFLLLRNIMVIPRSETTSFITNAITINNIVMYMAIIFISKLLYLVLKRL